MLIFHKKQNLELALHGKQYNKNPFESISMCMGKKNIFKFIYKILELKNKK